LNLFAILAQNFCDASLLRCRNSAPTYFATRARSFRRKEFKGILY